MKKPNLNALDAYWTALSAKEKRCFASRCGTSVQYIQKILCLHRQKKPFFVGCKIAICICRESGGYVTLDEMRPDVDWGWVRKTRSIT